MEPSNTLSIIAEAGSEGRREAALRAACFYECAIRGARDVYFLGMGSRVARSWGARRKRLEEHTCTHTTHATRHTSVLGSRGTRSVSRRLGAWGIARSSSVSLSVRELGAARDLHPK